MVEVVRLKAEEVRAEMPALFDLLKDAVDDGAGLGFLPPLSEREALEYWEETARVVDAGSRVVLAVREGAAILGSAQLDLCRRPNGMHRAEVTKVMVHRSARRRGVGAALMRALDEAARQERRTLLYLDTFEGHDANKLYLKAGYTEAGRIPEFAIHATDGLKTTVLYYKILR